MCYDYEFEYLARRAQHGKEQARKELKKAEERNKPQPAAPAEVPEERPVPA